MFLLAETLVQGAAGLGLVAVVGYYVLKLRDHKAQARLQAAETSLVEEARREADTILREARLTAHEESQARLADVARECATRREELNKIEARLVQRDGLINQQLDGLMRQEKTLAQKEQVLNEQEQLLAKERQTLASQMALHHEKLLQIAHLSEAEARAQILRKMEQETLKDAADLTRHLLDHAKATAETEARRIISTAIQRYSGEHAFETSTAALTLPNEEIKGRIIGREGRNIRAFEAATGVTVLIDDTPNAVVLSSFDPVRRQIAHESMHRLLLDGRIHPTRIEEIVARVTQEMDETILKAGEEAVFKVGLPPLHPEIVKLLGRLKFRRSYSQNILDHSVEVAHLAGLMAAELSMDVATAKRAGLLHDVGKAVNHEIEGAHAIIGADFIKRYGESEVVVNGVAAHHGEIAAASAIALLVSSADAISASRPGARSETMSTYIKRLENLERIAQTFPGVERCFALQAGRELRVMVQPDLLSDEQAFSLARSIARKIEDELQYPGQIRVTVVRETRCVEFAK